MGLNSFRRYFWLFFILPVLFGGIIRTNEAAALPPTAPEAPISSDALAGKAHGSIPRPLVLGPAIQYRASDLNIEVAPIELPYASLEAEPSAEPVLDQIYTEPDPLVLTQQGSEEIADRGMPFWAFCMGLTEGIANTYCQFPGSTSEEILVFFGQPIAGGLADHRFTCRMRYGNVRVTNSSHRDTFDGWDGNQYCQNGNSFSFMDSNYHYLGFMRPQLYQGSGWLTTALSFKDAVLARLSLVETCQGPPYPWQPYNHNCWGAYYDLVWALPRPWFNPPRSNSDCWQKEFIRRMTNWSVIPPVVSPCWG